MNMLTINMTQDLPFYGEYLLLLLPLALQQPKSNNSKFDKLVKIQDSITYQNSP